MQNKYNTSGFPVVKGYSTGGGITTRIHAVESPILASSSLLYNAFVWNCIGVRRVLRSRETHNRFS